MFLNVGLNFGICDGQCTYAIQRYHLHNNLGKITSTVLFTIKDR